MDYLKKFLRGTGFSLRNFHYPYVGAEGQALPVWELRRGGRTWFHLGAKTVATLDGLYAEGLLLVHVRESADEDDLTALRTLLQRYTQTSGTGVFVYRGIQAVGLDRYDQENERRAERLVSPGQYRERIAT